MFLSSVCVCMRSNTSGAKFGNQNPLVTVLLMVTWNFYGVGYIVELLFAWAGNWFWWAFLFSLSNCGAALFICGAADLIAEGPRRGQVSRHTLGVCLLYPVDNIFVSPWIHHCLHYSLSTIVYLCLTLSPGNPFQLFGLARVWLYIYIYRSISIYILLYRLSLYYLSSLVLSLQLYLSIRPQNAEHTQTWPARRTYFLICIFGFMGRRVYIYTFTPSEGWVCFCAPRPIVWPGVAGQAWPV